MPGPLIHEYEEELQGRLDSKNNEDARSGQFDHKNKEQWGHLNYKHEEVVGPGQFDCKHKEEAGLGHLDHKNKERWGHLNYDLKEEGGLSKPPKLQA